MDPENHWCRSKKQLGAPGALRPWSRNELLMFGCGSVRYVLQGKLVMTLTVLGDIHTKGWLCNRLCPMLAAAIARYL